MPYLSPNFKKKCYKYGSLFFEEEPAFNYYVFTTISILESTKLITLPTEMIQNTLPITWNYLDGICAIVTGIMQLRDKSGANNMKLKGLLNIFSGLQLFFLSFNPWLTELIGLTGGAALAGASFALAMLVDLVIACIDYYNAYKEGFTQKCKEAFNTLIVKSESFIGMTLLAVGGFALFSSNQPLIAVMGLFFTGLVSVTYLNRHQQGVTNKVFSYLSHSSKEERELVTPNP